jgi:hypothetical protein
MRRSGPKSARATRPDKRNSGAEVIEAAHTNALGPTGLGQKTTDFSAIPLCAGHHRENPDSYHRLGEHGFSRKHGIDLKELVLRLQSRFWQRDTPVPCAAHRGEGEVLLTNALQPLVAELANGCPHYVQELMNDLIRSMDRIRKWPAKVRGCILQSELLPFLH